MKTEIFTVYFINKWYKDESSIDAKRTQDLKNKIIKGFSNYKNNYSTNETKAIVEIRNLRASAGNILLDSIFKKMNRANALIVDITPNENEDMRNIWFELGIAISLSEIKEDLKVFVIYNSQSKKSDIPLYLLPSDLKGYFVSGYTYNSN